jgi:DNA-binding NarL/FixJ family response regulator
LDLKHITIFLADDDEDDRIFFKDAMAEIDQTHQLVITDSGDKVMDYFSNANLLPQFVFLDINMPVRNGIECLRYIKEKYPGNQFHVIMLSTSLAGKDIEQSYQYGASIYIQKPGNFSHLVSYLSYCLHELSFLRDRDHFILNQKFSKNHI